MGGWQDYLQFLLNNNCMSEAYILDLAGNIACSSNQLAAFPTWTKTVEVDDVNKETVTVDEKTIFLEAMQNGGKPKHPAGVHINKVKYFALQMDQERGVWYLKCPNGGACVAWTNKAILIGCYNITQNQSNNTPQSAGDCNKRVEDLSKMLRDAGW